MNKIPPQPHDDEEEGNLRSNLPEDKQEPPFKTGTRDGEQTSTHLEFHKATYNLLKRDPRSELPDLVAETQPVEPFPAKLSKVEELEPESKDYDEYKRSPAAEQLYERGHDVASPRVESGGQSGFDVNRQSKETKSRARR